MLHASEDKDPSNIFPENTTNSLKTRYRGRLDAPTILQSHCVSSFQILV